MYVLDTNTLIYFFKGMGRVAENLWAVPPGNIGIPSVVLYELEVGIAKSSEPKKRTRQLEAFCAVVAVLPFATEEAKTAAAIRVMLEKKGTPIGPYDVLIAATALRWHGTLVTRNKDEFRRIPKLVMTDWF